MVASHSCDAESAIFPGRFVSAGPGMTATKSGVLHKKPELIRDPSNILHRSFSHSR